MEAILDQVGLGHLRKRFSDNKVTMAEAKQLNDEELASLGVTAIGERIRFREAIKNAGQENSRAVLNHRDAVSLFRGNRRNSGTQKKYICRSWTGNFFCFSEKETCRIPNSTDKSLLQKAGLGYKKIQFLITDNAETVSEKLKVEYPKLLYCGGFELLRCLPNCRTLLVLDCNWDADSLRSTIGTQAKIYIRPIQKCLPTDDIESFPQEDINEKCINCSQLISVRDLRRHVEDCKMPTTEIDQQYEIASMNVNQAQVYLEQNLDLSLNEYSVLDMIRVSPNQPNSQSNAEAQQNKALPDAIEEYAGAQQKEAISDAIEESPNLPNSESNAGAQQTEAIPGAIEESPNQPSSLSNTGSQQEEPVWEQFKSKEFSDVSSAVKECASYCRLQNINNPVDILRIYQKMVLTGRPLDLSYETESTGIEGNTNFIMLDRSNLTQTAFDEISSLTDLRKCLEVQFYDETAVDYGGPRKEFFALILPLLQKEFFDPVREWSKDYEVIGKIMALSMLQNGKLPRLLSAELLQEMLTEESPRSFLQDLRRGIDSLGLLQLADELPTFVHLFTPGEPTAITYRMVTHLLKPTFSIAGSNNRQFQASVYSLFLKYIREAASGRRGNINLGSILRFATGAEEEPVLGFTISPSIMFVDSESFIPTAQTCINQLQLPRASHGRDLPPQDILFKLYDYAFANQFYGLK